MSEQRNLPTLKASVVLEAALAQSNILCASWQAIRDSARATGDKALESEADARIVDCREQAMRLLGLLRGFGELSSPPNPPSPKPAKKKRKR